MRRLGIIILIAFLSFTPAFAQSNMDIISSIFSSENGVFTYHIPEDDDEKQTDNQNQGNNTTETTTPKTDIISDDITEDTSGIISVNNPTNENEQSESDDYDIDDMYSYILKGSVVYDEDEENAIPLELPDNQLLTFYTQKPVSVKEKYFGYLKPSDSLYSNVYSMYNGTEYSIKPISGQSSKTIGSWSAGTTYSQSIDYGELEQSSGVYSKYSYKNFAISTSYAKTVNTTNNNYNDNFYITPELKLNQYFTIKNILSVDTVKKRKKAEVILSINPFGNHDIDRFRLELGANETYDEINNSFKNQFKFSTNFKF